MGQVRLGAFVTAAIVCALGAMTICLLLQSNWGVDKVPVEERQSRGLNPTSEAPPASSLPTTLRESLAVGDSRSLKPAMHIDLVTDPAIRHLEQQLAKLTPAYLSQIIVENPDIDKLLQQPEINPLKKELTPAERQELRLSMSTICEQIASARRFLEVEICMANRDAVMANNYVTLPTGNQAEFYQKVAKRPGVCNIGNLPGKTDAERRMVVMDEKSAPRIANAQARIRKLKTDLAVIARAYVDSIGSHIPR